MVDDLRYFNSLKEEVDSLKSQLETQRTQFLNEIDLLSWEYYYADHMNDILYTYTRVIPTTNVSRPQLKRNRLEDRVMHNNSQGKKQEVEDHRRNFKFSNNKTFVTACNDSLNAKTSNVNFVYVACGKCVLNDNHDMCVLHYINGMNSRTKQPIIVPISTKEPKRTVNQSIATSLKKIVALESTNQKPRSTIRKQYEHVIKTCRRWYSKTTPAGYKWKPKSSTTNAKSNVSVPLGIQSRTTNISEHMTLRKSTLSNTSSSSNHFSSHRDNPIHHRLWVLKAHDVAFQKSTCYARDSRASSSQAWLWHSRLSHLNFNTINLLSMYDIMTGLPKLKFVKDHLFSSCELGKAKRKRIEHQTSTARTPEQNGVVERRHRTLVEAARTMLNAVKVPLYFSAEAIATSCFTQNRSLVTPRHEKTPYHIINGQKQYVETTLENSVTPFGLSSDHIRIFPDGVIFDEKKLGSS
ncbi:retrovirus-related pol polyprotein from transposon TNT 1-94 [Tanacetum coccineum]